MTSASSPRGAPRDELLRALRWASGAANLHYGSDFPFTPADVCAEPAQQMERTPLLDDGQRDQMFGGNARALLPRFSS